LATLGNKAKESCLENADLRSIVLKLSSASLCISELCSPPTGVYLDAIEGETLINVNALLDWLGKETMLNRCMCIRVINSVVGVSLLDVAMY